MKRAVEEGSPQIVDARSAARFRGEAPEPRPGVRSGHIPGSFNLPWREIAENGEMRPPQEIAAAFAKAGVDLDRPIITTCGSGVTAAILLLALETAGKNDVALYDGSWAEWGANGYASREGLMPASRELCTSATRLPLRCDSENFRSDP